MPASGRNRRDASRAVVASRRRGSARRSRSLGRQPSSSAVRSRPPSSANASTSAGTSSSASPAVITSANGASGSGFTNVTAPPMTTSGSRACAALRARLEAGQPQHGDDVRCSPTRKRRRRRRRRRSRTGVCDSIVTSGSRRRGGRNLLLRRQEDALTHDAVVGVEEWVNRLQAEIRHPHEVGVGERQGHTQPSAVRLPDVPTSRARSARARVRGSVGGSSPSGRRSGTGGRGCWTTNATISVACRAYAAAETTVVLASGPDLRRLNLRVGRQALGSARPLGGAGSLGALEHLELR